MIFLAAATARPAIAEHWNVDYAKSRLGFTVQWSGEPFHASFRNWNADIDFDPGDLSRARAVVTVDLGSEVSDEPDFDSGLKGAEGFATSRFPTARFTTSGFTRAGSDRYRTDGTLSLHGFSRNISLPFILATNGRNAHMTATVHVRRTDFGLGQGEWAAPDPVAYDVAITIDLVATK